MTLLTTSSIIAVHGLNPRSKNERAHAWDTWRTPSGSKGHLWLYDLPQIIPATRIFLYEYNSTAVYGKDRDTFIGKANELLEAIRIERYEIVSRPILFIGHSLGGLLIKQALINAHNNPKYTPIKDATTGLAFFGTPHHGSNRMLVSLGGMVSQIATGMGFQKGDDVLETLKSRSIFSEIIQEHWRHQLLRYDIISFWGSLDKIVTAESARLGLPGDHENVVKLNADHSGLCKFGSSLEDQDNLKLVKSNIRDLHKKAIRKNTTSSQGDDLFDNEEYGNFLGALYTSKYASHRMRVPKRAPETCEWILNHALYNDWLCGGISPILWVSGDPGCGKSVLASFLLDHFSNSRENIGLQRKVCYFFFRDDNPEQQSALHAICAILHQLFTSDRRITNVAFKDWRTKGVKLIDDFFSLWLILMAAGSHQSSGEVICILDGLDECTETSLSELLNALQLFNQNEGRASGHSQEGLKFLIFSRPYLKIGSKLAAISSIRLRAENESTNTARDVNVFIRQRVERIGLEAGFSSAQLAGLIDQLMNKADRTFLWVSLVFESIESSDRMSPGALAELIDTNPADLDATYEKILSRSRNPKNTRKILSIVLAAIRPMTLSEMNFALNIKDLDSKAEDVDLEPSIERAIKNGSALFVRVIDSKIFLVHQTARRFLLTTSNGDIMGQCWAQSLNLNHCHLLMARICILYIHLSDFENQPLSSVRSGSLGVQLYCQEYKFIEYAACYWAEHYREAGVIADGLYSLSALICDDHSYRFRTWSLIYWNSLGRKTTSNASWTHLIARSAFNHINAVKKLLDRGVNIEEDCGGSYGHGTALHWAASLGHCDMVQLLLDIGKAAINANNNNGETALHLAIGTSRSQDLIALLLGHGADISVADKDGKTPLHLAARVGRMDIVDELLNLGGNIKVRDRAQHSPVYYAFEGGHSSVGDSLISRGGDRKERDFWIDVPGTVKWFNSQKGYGFIQPEREWKDLFVHFSSINTEDHKLNEGERVRFDIEKGARKYQARSVRRESPGI